MRCSVESHQIQKVNKYIYLTHTCVSGVTLRCIILFWSYFCSTLVSTSYGYNPSLHPWLIFSILLLASSAHDASPNVSVSLYFLEAFLYFYFLEDSVHPMLLPCPFQHTEVLGTYMLLIRCYFINSFNSRFIYKQLVLNRSWIICYFSPLLAISFLTLSKVFEYPVPYYPWWVWVQYIQRHYLHKSYTKLFWVSLYKNQMVCHQYIQIHYLHMNLTLSYCWHWGGSEVKCLCTLTVDESINRYWREDRDASFPE